MSDMVEQLARAWCEEYGGNFDTCDNQIEHREFAVKMLDVLGLNGFEIYRPDAVPQVICFPSDQAGELVDFDGYPLQVVGDGNTVARMPDYGRYYLVPVGNDA